MKITKTIETFLLRDEMEKELEELDKNTVQYMIDEMQDAIDAQKEQLSRKDKTIDAQKEQLNQKDEQLSRKDKSIDAQKEQLIQKDATIEQLQKQIRELKGEK